MEGLHYSSKKFLLLSLYFQNQRRSRPDHRCSLRSRLVSTKGRGGQVDGRLGMYAAALDAVTAPVFGVSHGNTLLFANSAARSLLQRQQWVRVSNGADLSPEDCSHLFERFWRKEAARSARGHVGLGLPLAQGFAGAMAQARFVGVPNVGHVPHLERPDAFMSAVLEFLG